MKDFEEKNGGPDGERKGKSAAFLLFPILAWVCEVASLIPSVLDALASRLGWALQVSFPIEVAALFVFPVGLILAVLGICFRKRMGKAGLILSIVALCNPLVVWWLITGSLTVGALFFM